MSITGILIAAACVGIVGIFVGLFLGVAGIKFKVEVDEKEEAVLAAFPGNNCGGCGFAGCSGLAAAIAKGEAAVNTCPVGGEEVGKKIAAIMGVEAEASERMVAYVHCQGDCERTTTDYDYYGIKDCRMMSFVPGGGPKSCNSGCLGFGTCEQACPFDAIHVENGVAVVDKEKCKGLRKVRGGLPQASDQLTALFQYGTGSLQFYGQGPRYHEGLQDRLCGLRYLRKELPARCCEGREFPCNH